MDLAFKKEQMDKEQTLVIESIREIIELAELQDAEILLEQLYSLFELEEASMALAEVFIQEYTSFREGYLAELLERIIKYDPEVAEVNFPTNPLFKAAYISGSTELFNCYMECAELPQLKSEGNTAAELSDAFASLQSAVSWITPAMTQQFEQCVVGRDYNGAFSELQGNSGVVLINKEDYEFMEEIVDQFNKIVGRAKILKELSRKEEFYEKMYDKWE